VRFAVTNVSAKAVRSYLVSVFYFHRVERHGSATGVQHPTSPLSMGQSHQGGLLVYDQVPLTLTPRSSSASRR
jgi:hypothetical protein